MIKLNDHLGRKVWAYDDDISYFFVIMYVVVSVMTVQHFIHISLTVKRKTVTAFTQVRMP